jgi:hypothetical protein
MLPCNLLIKENKFLDHLKKEFSANCQGKLQRKMLLWMHGRIGSAVLDVEWEEGHLQH